RRALHSSPTRRSSDLAGVRKELQGLVGQGGFTEPGFNAVLEFLKVTEGAGSNSERIQRVADFLGDAEMGVRGCAELREVLEAARSEEHTSELQSRENL